MTGANEVYEAAVRAIQNVGPAELLTESEKKLARRDVNAFAELCFVDESGNPIKQAPHHRIFQDLSDEHHNLIMHFPVEHGKTTQTIIRLIWLLGNHPDRQYGYVSSKANNAVKVVSAVAREILNNKRIKAVFPNLKPQKGALRSGPERWGGTAFRVQGCPPGRPDPSLAAYGIDGQILGSRLHGIFIDNVLDRENTSSKTQREKVTDLIESEVMTRVLPGGFVTIIDTAWHDDDALHTLSKRAGWFHQKFDAMKGLVDGETLWNDRFPLERLEAIKGKIGPLSFDRMYRNKPISLSKAFFKEKYWDSAYGRCVWVDTWPEDGLDLQMDLRTGVDLSTGEGDDDSAFATVVARGHRRQLVNLIAGQFEGTEILRKMVHIYRTLHKPVNRAGGNAKFVVEDNATQKYIVQMLKDAGVLRAIGLTSDEAADIRVVGRTTTSKKRDLELGIPGIANGFEMDRWDVAMGDECINLRYDMKTWSPDLGKHTGDRLMALWIANSDLLEAQSGFTVDYL